MKKYWNFLGSSELFHDTILKLRHDRYDFNCGKVIKDFTVLEFGDWVNIIPITANGDIVMIRQFRHGCRDTVLEIPGGLIEPGEDPAAAALRELQEETGYGAGGATKIGLVQPNPAIQNNACHIFMARDAALVSQQNLDATEAIEVVLVPMDRVYDMIAAGAISHGLVVAAFMYLCLYQHDITGRIVDVGPDSK